MKLGLLITTLVLLAGCSSTSTSTSKPQLTNSKKVEMKCEVSSRTGSKLKRKRCVDAAYAKAEREEAKKLMRDALNNAGSIVTEGN